MSFALTWITLHARCRPKFERVFTYTGPQIVQLRSAAHEVTGIARTVHATTASPHYTWNRTLFHRPIRLDAAAMSPSELGVTSMLTALCTWLVYHSQTRLWAQMLQSRHHRRMLWGISLALFAITSETEYCLPWNVGLRSSLADVGHRLVPQWSVQGHFWAWIYQARRPHCLRSVAIANGIDIGRVVLLSRCRPKKDHLLVRAMC